MEPLEISERGVQVLRQLMDLLFDRLRQLYRICPSGIAAEEVEPVFRRGPGGTALAEMVIFSVSMTHPIPAVWYAVQESTCDFSYAVRPVHAPSVSNRSARYCKHAVPSNTITSSLVSGS